MLVMKVDSSSFSLPWIRVFIPLWLGMFMSPFFIYWIFLRHKTVRENIGIILWIYTTLSSFGLFTVLLPLKLDNPSLLPWFGVFIPFWITLSLLLIVSDDYRSEVREFNTKDHGLLNRMEYFLKYVIISFGIFSILHVIHLESYAHISWVIRFLPFLIAGGLYVTVEVVHVSFYDEDRLDGFLGWWVILPLILFMVLLLVYLLGSIQYFALACIPLFIVELVIWFLSCIPCIYL